MLPISLLVFFFAQEILEIITGKSVDALNIYLLKVTSLMLIVFPYGSQLTNILVTLKESKVLNKILFTAALFNLILAPILLHFYEIIGLIWLNAFIAYFLIIIQAFYIHRAIKTNKREKDAI